MLDVALIGLGTDWDARFLPALLNLRQRLRIRGVYSAIGNQADQAATDLSCRTASGINALLARSNIRAALILDPGLCPLFPIELAAQRGKTLFLARSPLEQLQALAEFRESAHRGNGLLIPSCEWRYHPTTSRLRELIATKLGKPQEISISVSTISPSSNALSNSPPRPAPSADDNDQQPAPLARSLWELFDWCCFLLVRPLQSLQAIPAAGAAGQQMIHLEFLPSASGGPAPRASIECPVNSDGLGWIPPDASIRLEVTTAKGRALISSAVDIEWAAVNEQATESLTRDRTAEEVMLDHFARRAVGGLIPVPHMDDVAQAHKLVALAEESLRTRRPIVIS